MSEALQSLIERVEKATEADREIDKDLAKHTLGAWIRATTRGDAWRYQMLLAEDEGVFPDALPDVPAYTASIDAALSLVERVLPGWDVEITTHVAFNGDVAFAHARLSNPDIDLECDDYTANAPTPALALCLALLRAVSTVQAKNEATEDTRG